MLAEDTLEMRVDWESERAGAGEGEADGREQEVQQPPPARALHNIHSMKGVDQSSANKHTSSSDIICRLSNTLILERLLTKFADFYAYK